MIMQSHEVPQIFGQVYNHATNFMTPDVIKTGSRMAEGNANMILWELSKGRGMDQQPIFGVTVLVRANPEQDATKARRVYHKAFSISCMHESLKAAEAYIRRLPEILAEQRADDSLDLGV